MNFLKEEGIILKSRENVSGRLWYNDTMWISTERRRKVPVTFTSTVACYLTLRLSTSLARGSSSCLQGISKCVDSLV